MSLLRFTIAAFLTTLITCAAGASARAGAPGCAVIIDVSASMAGFNAGGGGPKFRALLGALGRRCTEHHTLGDTLKPAGDDLAALRFDEQETRLGESLEKWIRQSSADRVVILTDNVADTKGAGGDDQQRFYGLIKSPRSRFTRVSVMLARLPFEGPVYGAPGEPVRRYSQSRALALYVLQRRSVEGDFAGDIRQVLQSRSVDLNRLKDEDEDAAAGFYEISLLPFEPDAAPVDFTLQGEHRNVSVADVTATVTFPDDPRFGAGGQESCQADPPALPSGEGPVSVRLTCRLASPIPGMDAAQRQAVANSRMVRAGWLNVSVTARPRGLGLGQGLSRWSYDPPSGHADLGSPTPEVQGRIYRLGDLLAGMSPQEEVHPAVARIPVQQRLYFFRPAPFLETGLLIALAAAIGAMLYAASRPFEVEVTAAGARETKQVRLAANLLVELRGGLATVLATKAGFWIRAEEGPVRPMLLGPGGGRVIIGRDRQQLDIRVRTAHAPARRQNRKPPPRRR
jgi:hypothetical protein